MLRYMGRCEDVKLEALIISYSIIICKKDIDGSQDFFPSIGKLCKAEGIISAEMIS